MKIFVLELNKIIEKGTGEGEIKIPNSLYDNVKDFFGNNFKHVTDDKGKERLAISIKLDILDVKDGKKYEDTAILYDAGKYYALKSSVLKSLATDEGDIVRLIKKSESDFEVELIRKGIKEYEIWDNFLCTYLLVCFQLIERFENVPGISIFLRTLLIYRCKTISFLPYTLDSIGKKISIILSILNLVF